MTAVAIILAAGRPRSMSHPKALIEHEGGKSFLQSLASTFGKAGCKVLGVVGYEETMVRDQHPSTELVTSPNWERSQMASVKAGLKEALEPSQNPDRDPATVVLIHSVDMPSVRATTLKTLLKSVGEDTMLRPEFEGAPGMPLVLSASMARKLMDAEGDDLETVLKALNPKRVSVKDPGVIVNINRSDVYQRLFTDAPKLAPAPKRRGTKKMGGTANDSGSDMSSPASYAASPSDK
jgi:molybdenum cofactor cytidylyltransferase